MSMVIAIIHEVEGGTGRTRRFHGWADTESGDDHTEWDEHSGRMPSVSDPFEALDLDADALADLEG